MREEWESRDLGRDMIIREWRKHRSVLSEQKTKIVSEASA